MRYIAIRERERESGGGDDASKCERRENRQRIEDGWAMGRFVRM